MQKDNSPLSLASKTSKSPKSSFDKKKEISFEKSVFLEANEDKLLMQDSAISSIKKKKKTNEDQVSFILYFINFLYELEKQ